MIDITGVDEMETTKTTIHARLKVKGGYLKLIESSQRESGRADGSTDGRNLSAPKFPKGASYNLWQVLRVAVLTALSPERRNIPRCLSPLKPLMVSEDVGRTLNGREILRPGAGSMAGEIAPAGFIPSLKRRYTNSSAPELCAIVQFR